MGYMEITVQSAASLKIKGKYASVFINPQDKTANYNAAILIGNPVKSSLKIREDVVTIDGPGEYEAGGIKISGIKTDSQTVYTLSIDNLDLVIGTKEALEKVHQKLQEQAVAIIQADTIEGDTSFISSLGLNARIFYGTKARELADIFAKDTKKESSKYVITAEKLPLEAESVLLVSGN